MMLTSSLGCAFSSATGFSGAAIFVAAGSAFSVTADLSTAAGFSETEFFVCGVADFAAVVVFVDASGPFSDSAAFADSAAFLAFALALAAFFASDFDTGSDLAASALALVTIPAVAAAVPVPAKLLGSKTGNGPNELTHGVGGGGGTSVWP